MRRVMVVGPGGAGKTVFADRLGRVLGLPVVHLDVLYFRPDTGAGPLPEEEWRALQRRLVAEPAWVHDGTFIRSVDIRMAAADTVVFLDPPRPLCLARGVGRAVRSRLGVAGPDGITAGFTWSLARWVLRFPRAKLLAAAAEHAPHARLVHLRTRKQTTAFLRAANPGAPRSPH